MILTEISVQDWRDHKVCNNKVARKTILHYILTYTTVSLSHETKWRLCGCCPATLAVMPTPTHRTRTDH